MSNDQQLREALQSAEEMVHDYKHLTQKITRIHSQYMGKAMPECVYDHFARLRDEEEPAKRKQLIAALAAAPQAAAPDRLHTFLDAAAGDGLVCGGVDAADLCIELFPGRYPALAQAAAPACGQVGAALPGDVAKRIADEQFVSYEVVQIIASRLKAAAPDHSGDANDMVAAPAEAVSAAQSAQALVELHAVLSHPDFAVTFPRLAEHRRVLLSALAGAMQSALATPPQQAEPADENHATDLSVDQFIPWPFARLAPINGKERVVFMPQEVRQAIRNALAAHPERVAELEAEVERLTRCLAKANSQAEHFEREWYLRGDEVERLRAKYDAALDVIVDLGGELREPEIDEARTRKENAERYEFLRHHGGDVIATASGDWCAPDGLDAAVDAARKGAT